MEEQKQILLSKLYALRAGMSVISEEKEQADKIARAAKEQRDRVINEEKSKEEKLLSQKEDDELKLENLNNDLRDTNTSSCRFGLSYFYLGLLWRFLLLIVSLVVVSYSWCCCELIPIDETPILQFLCGWTGKLPYFVEWLINLLVFVIGITGFCIMVHSIFEHCKYNYYGVFRFIRAVTYRRKSREQLIVQIAVMQNKIKDITLKINKQHTASAERMGFADKSYREEIEKKALPHIEAAKVLLKSLLEEYNDVIDFRDWKYIDSLIFSIETNRCDTVKEALRFVDDERRKNEIVNTLKTASEQIRNRINEMQNDMRRCFCLMADHITDCTAKTIRAISISNESINGQFNLQAQYISNISGQVNMQNALMRKASVPGERIADDVRIIRDNVQQIGDYYR